MFEFRQLFASLILEKANAWIYFDEDAGLLRSVQVQNKDSPVTETRVQTVEK